MTVAGDEPAHREFLDYFEKTWIGQPGRPPLFPRAMWNNREITLVHLPRTTNSLEGWHHQIQALFTAPHPNIFRFVEGLQEENTRINAICVKLNGGEEVPLYTRREYRQANERLLRVLGRYNEMDAIRFYRTTAYFIKYRGVDPVLENENKEDEDEGEFSDGSVEF